MYKEILKKKKKSMMDEESMPQEEFETSEEEESYSKPLKVGKKAAEHVMASMAPEGSMEEEKAQMKKKSIMPEAKIEIELMIESAKKKKKK